jgi:F-type H+-transporting ATPase subunit gamma
MPTLRKIKENLEVIETIKNITNVYHEIANLKMKRVREGVLRNRKFFEELLSVYQKVKSAYLFSFKKEGAEGKEVSFLEGRKERIIIFLSANQFFYGSLILDVWSKVFSYLTENKADLLVVGRLGKYLAESAGFGHKMFYFELNDEKPEERNIAAIIEFIKDYKKIIAFYGRYKTVLSQEPAMNEISELPFEEMADKKVKKYLFEPSPEAVLEFFEKEIIAVLFNQCILENQLARYASRVIAMYRARENAKDLRGELEKIKNKLVRQALNKEQIELFAKIKI